MNPVAAGWGDAQRVFDVLDAALARAGWGRTESERIPKESEA
jgi:glutathione S-transferase